MKNFVRKNTITVMIATVTMILAGVAIFTALKLYELRQQPVSPNVPASSPSAKTSDDEPKACTALSFTLTTPTPTPTATPFGSATPTPTPTPTPTSTPYTSPTPNSCGGTCGSNNNCSSGYTCYQGVCRNSSCPEQGSCACPGTPPPVPSSTPTSTPRSGSGPTSTPGSTLPAAGFGTPAILGIGLGGLLLLFALGLAL